mgnify:CR=1 FL=1
MASVSDDEVVAYFETNCLAHFPFIRVRRTGSGWNLNPVRFWAAIRGIALELWQLPDANDLRPGLDLAITEVVPYKSRKEVGVMKALAWCMATHWDSRMSVLAAPVVVVLGAVARQALDLPLGAVVQRTIGGLSRTVITLAHPNAFGGGKRPREFMGSHDLERIAHILRRHRLPQRDR